MPIQVEDQDKYDYRFPILYETNEEEREAFNLGIKKVYMGYNSNNGKCMGINSGHTDCTDEEKYKKAFKSGDYIAWKQLRKYYAKYLDSNPFEIGDKIECIHRTTKSTSKQIGQVFTIQGNALVGNKEFVLYTSGESAIYTDFKLHGDIIISDYNLLSDKDWRDPFIQILNLNYTKSNYNAAVVIQCTKNVTCDHGTILLAYVSLFRVGGFWFDDDGMYFTTAGSGPANPKATYQHAKNFIKSWKEKSKL